MRCSVVRAHMVSPHHDSIGIVFSLCKQFRMMSVSLTLAAAGSWPLRQPSPPFFDGFRQPCQFPLRLHAAQAAFPEQNHLPPGLLQVSNGFPVAPHVAGEFCLPEFDIAGRCRGILASSMSMPVTPLNEHDRAVLRKNEIRLTRQLSVMQPITQSLTMQKASDQHFWLSILAANAGHHARPDRRSNYVCHGHTLFQHGTCRINRPSLAP